MGRFGFDVVDADGHIYEVVEMYEQIRDRYLQGRYRDMLAEALRGDPTAGEAGRVAPWAKFSRGPMLRRDRPLGVPNPEKRPAFRTEMGNKTGTKANTAPLDPVARLEDMDIEGVDTAVIFPSALNGFCAVEDTGLEAAVYEGYNRWMADHCAQDPKRLKYAAVVSMRDIEAGVGELRRAARDNTVVSMYCSTHMDGVQLDDPGFDPLWATARDLDLPVTIHHASAALPPWGLGVWDMTENWFQQHVSSNPYEQMRAATTVIGGGVLERFPKLRVVFLEAGCGWVPWWLERLDEHYELLPDFVPLLKHEPSRFFRNGQCFVSFDPDEKSLPFVLSAMGDGQVVYASDYPHWDGTFPDSVKIIAGRHDIPDQSKPKILGENARRLYPRVN